MEWYYTIERTRHGPVDTEALKELLADRVLTGHTLVWSESIGDHWVLASQVPELRQRQKLSLARTRRPTASGIRADGQLASLAGPEAILQDSRRVDYLISHIHNRFDSGVSRSRVRRELVDQNVPAEAVAELMARVIRLRNAESRQRGMRHLAAGIVLAGAAAATYLLRGVWLSDPVVALVWCLVVLVAVLQTLTGFLRAVFGGVRRFVSVPVATTATVITSGLLLRHFGLM